MDSNIRVQKLVLDYFKDHSDYVIAGVVRTIVYDEPCTTAIQAIVDKFLSDNGITTAYKKYKSDQANPKRSFNSVSGAELNILSSMQQALLNLIVNRYRILATEQKPVVEKKVKPWSIKVLDTGEVHGLSNHPDYAICSLQLYEDVVGKTEEVRTKINCPQCLEIIKLCKKY
jgi:hypothetical protein